MIDKNFADMNIDELIDSAALICETSNGVVGALALETTAEQLSPVAMVSAISHLGLQFDLIQRILLEISAKNNNDQQQDAA